MAYPEVAVDASDVSADALAVARLNVDRHRLGDAHHADRVRPVREAAGALRPDPLQPALRQRREHGRAAGRVPRRAGARARRRRRRHGPDPRASSPRRAAHMSDDAVLVLEVGHERAHFEQAFPRLECAWLETSGGDDRVVLIERARADRACAMSRACAAKAAKITHARSHPGLAAPRRQARPRSHQPHHPARREGRPGRPQRRRQVVAVLAARRPPARRRRRRLRAAALAHRRGRAGDARDRAGRDRLRPRRRQRAGRGARPSSRAPRRATTATRWRTRTRRSSSPAASTRGRARRRCCSASASRPPSSTRRCRASRAAGACACSSRAR